MTFTNDELKFINEWNVDPQHANVNLLKSKEEEVAKLCGHLPAGKDTDRYIANLTTGAVKSFKQGLNKKLHSFAKEIK